MCLIPGELQQLDRVAGRIGYLLPKYSHKPMKLAVLSDIHSNLFALQAVTAHLEQWKPDRVVVAGDVVNRGSRPRECLEWVLEKERDCGWLTVRGNHEDYVLTQADPEAPRAGPAFEVHRGSYWTYQQLLGEVSALVAMPFQQSFTDPLGGEARVLHASMRGNRDGIFPRTGDETLREQVYLPPALFCVGHTHCALIRKLDQTLVVNAGSVGLPFDGDRRAGYAQLTWMHGEWRAEIIRLEYDYGEAERDFFASGFMEGAGPLAELVMVELRQARSLLFHWALTYQERALAGEISMEQSVREFLASL
jgi:predicted phosphodiesterase